jgi:hypothetical protein
MDRWAGPHDYILILRTSLRERIINEQYREVKVELSLCINRAPRHEGVLGEWWYSSTHSLTSALHGVSGQLHAPFSLPPGKEPLIPTG